MRDNRCVPQGTLRWAFTLLVLQLRRRGAFWDDGHHPGMTDTTKATEATPVAPSIPQSLIALASQSSARNCDQSVSNPTTSAPVTASTGRASAATPRWL